MYYLHKKTRNSNLPEFSYIFKDFNEFYELANVIEVPLIGTCYILIKTDDYEEVLNFIKRAEDFRYLVVYIEVSESLLKYIALREPCASYLSDVDNFEVFKELITKHEILFDAKCLRPLYYAIPHNYEDMDIALQEIKSAYPDARTITLEHISRLFPIDTYVYPRQVLISYLRMDRWRKARLNKCLETFGNDLCYYAMRKTLRNLLKEKISYLKTGDASKWVKMLPTENIVKMMLALDYNHGKFRDVYTILNLYEKGENVYDFISKRTCPIINAEYDDA